MIEIEFKAKGKSLKELLQHMDMVGTLMKLRINDEVVTRYKNRGKTISSEYEWSIQIARNELWIESVAVRIKGSSMVLYQKENGTHADLIEPIIENGYKLDEVEQGFLLKDGTFLDRVEAKTHAYNIGQIKEMIGTKLYSHELW